MACVTLPVYETLCRLFATMNEWMNEICHLSELSLRASCSRSCPSISPLASVNTPRSLSACRWYPTRLAPWNLSFSEVCRAAPRLAGGPEPGRHTDRRQTPDRIKRTDTKKPEAKMEGSSRLFNYRAALTSFSVTILGCCPYRSKISISSEGSFLTFSIIWRDRK